MHQQGAQAILAKVGLDEHSLKCILDRPLDEELRRTSEPTRFAMNCSGKHAGMLATCVINGWPTETYLEPTHPLQLAIKAEVEAMSGEKVVVTSVDGCGAPLFLFSLLGLARAIRNLTISTDQIHQDVAQACRDFPEMVAGPGRLGTRMMQNVPGLFMKEGAEAVNVASLPDGRTLAIKISDGNQRAMSAITAAALAKFGIDAHEVPINTLGAGLPVGVLFARPSLKFLNSNKGRTLKAYEWPHCNLDGAHIAPGSTRYWRCWRHEHLCFGICSAHGCYGCQCRYFHAQNRSKLHQRL